MVPKQDAIERADRGHDIVVALGEENVSNHRINRRIFDTDNITEPDRLAASEPQ
jgi:hypothetical protein